MLAVFIMNVHVLRFDGLVHKDLEGGKVMKIQFSTKIGVQSLTKPFLLLGISGHFLKSIASKSPKLSTVLIH